MSKNNTFFVSDGAAENDDNVASGSNHSLQSEASEAKKPCKGILKTSSSFDKQSANYRKNAKFDELNVMQTYHPADKDYGHMKIDEPKTPFVFTTESDPGKEFDANLLADKLRVAANTQTPAFAYDENSDEDIPETAGERVHRLEFEKRRKAHYNEYKAVMLARKLIQVELEDEDNSDIDDADHMDEAGSTASPKSKSGAEHRNARIGDSSERRSLNSRKISENTEQQQQMTDDESHGRVTSFREMDVDQCAGDQE